MNPSPHILIVGAGLAGLSCAYYLVQRGYKTTVIEARSVLGGRTSSWNQAGMTVESGLHKMLGTYRELPRLLSATGTTLDNIVAWVDAMELHSPHDFPNRGYFTAAPFHRPWATLSDALTSKYLSWSERYRLFRLATQGLFDTIYHPAKIDTFNLTDYAARFHISPKTIRKIFQPLTQGVFFLPPDQYSSYATFSPVLAGLKNGGTFRIGAFKGGMTDVLINPIVKKITENGGDIKINTRAVDLRMSGSKITGIQTNAGDISADYVVIATPLMAAQQLLRKHFNNQSWVKPLMQLKTVSTISVQFELSAPVFSHDHTHFSNTALACFAEQSHTTFSSSNGRFSGIIYPADHLLAANDQSVIKIALQAAAKLNLKLSSIKKSAVVRHPHEFYAIQPGAESLRPSGMTPVPGLTLAGDYIRQPFLASMEGAVISGKRAAGLVHQQVNK